MMRATVVCGAVLVLAVAAVGCGSSGESRIMTPDERLAEEERLAYEAEQAQKKREAEQGTPVYDDTPEAKGFDQKQAEMELRRATRSAESCTGVVADSKERGEATVNIVFANDGSVANATISPPFDGTPLGDCVVNAYKSVIVPPFDGSDHPMPWELMLSDPPKTADDKAPKKKK